MKKKDHPAPGSSRTHGHQGVPLIGMATTHFLWALGPAGTNGHQAAINVNQRQHLDGEIRFADCHEDIFGYVLARPGDFGIVPIENASAGLVSEVLRFWLQPDREAPHIVGETWLPIRHHLLAQERVERSELRSVISHEQALRQCETRLVRMRMQTSSVGSTALAAKMVLESRDRSLAALASPLAAVVYGLEVVEKDLQGDVANETHFFVLGSKAAQPTGDDKTAILIWTSNEHGALDSVIHPITEAGANMHAIHSIPLGRRERYAFYVEISGHREDPETSELLRVIRKNTQRLTILGSFPRWNG
jgi:prephenate dehydratase